MAKGTITAGRGVLESPMTDNEYVAYEKSQELPETARNHRDSSDMRKHWGQGNAKWHSCERSLADTSHLSR